MWLQSKTAQTRQMYLKAKKEAQQVAKKAKSDEWIKLGESLQHDLCKEQQNVWK